MDQGAARMAIESLIKRVSFAAGEVGPALFARNDLARWQIGLARLDNMVVQLEGGLTRAPGTRFVLAHKNEAQAAAFIPFRFSGADAYMLVINGSAMRLIKDGGFLESAPGVLYELAVPYGAPDLANLRHQQFGNRVFIVCAGHPPRVLTRLGHTDWTLQTYLPAGGPVDTQNLDPAKTIQASAVIGAGTTLTGVGTAFAAGDIGGVFRLDEADLTKVPAWRPNEIIRSPDIVLTGATTIGDFDLTPAKARDGISNATIADCAVKSVGDRSSAYYGLDLGAAPRPISRARIYGSNTLGYSDGASSEGVTIEARLYGKTGAAPTSATDGTVLGTTSFANRTDESIGRDVFAADPVTIHQYLWVTISLPEAPPHVYLAEIAFYRLKDGVPRPQRRYNGRVYLAISDGDTGFNPPVHDEGDASAGFGDVNWRFLHGGYGFVRVTAVTDATHLTGDILARLPDSAVDGPTYRWFPPAWSPQAGWPERIHLHDERLVFTRRETFWLTRPSDLYSLETLPASGDVANPDSALALRLSPRRSGLPWIEWLQSHGVLMLGLRDGESVVRAPQQFEALTVDKTRVVPGSSEGSAPHEPVDVDDGVLFIGRSRKRLHFARFDALPEAIDTEEVTIGNRAILDGLALRLAWQRDPDRIAWIACQNGILIGLTFMPKQQVLGFFRRSFANGFVEEIASIPSSNEGVSEVYLSVRRTVAGATRRYIERMQDPFRPLDPAGPTAAGAWFVDCALAYDGPPVAVLGGLAHLEGQSVRILADGAQIEGKSVAGGTVTLAAPASSVVVGLPLKGFVRSLPIEVETARGSTTGRTKRVHHVVLDVIDSAGGRVSSNSGPWEEIAPTGDLAYGAAVPLFSGPLRVALAGPSGLAASIALDLDHALPFTLAGFSPGLEVELG